jgi:hypothetical protein
MCIQVTKVRSQASDISRPTLGDGDSTDRTSQANLRKLNFTNTLYQLTYSLVLCDITAHQHNRSYINNKLTGNIISGEIRHQSQGDPG